MKADLGDKISPFAIEKLSMATNQKLMGGILSKKIRIVKLHYKQGMGYWHCFEGECCDVAGIPGVRYVFPLCLYPCDLTGELLIPVEELTFEDLVVKMLVVGRDDYENILTKEFLQAKQGKDITKIDLLITCTDQEYQKKQFDAAGPATWRSVMNKDSYTATMKFFHNNAEKSLGRTHDPQSFQKALLEGSASTPAVDRPQAGAPAARAIPKVPTKQLEEDIDFGDMFDEDSDTGAADATKAAGQTADFVEPDDDDIPF